MSALERLQRANPVPDRERLLAGSRAMDAFVQSVRQRSSTVDTTPMEETVALDDAVNPQPREVSGPPGVPKGRGLRVAVAAVLVALVGVAGVMWLISGDDPLAFGAQPPEVLAAYEDAFNRGDVDALVALFTEEAVIEGYSLGDSLVVGGDEIRTFFTNETGREVPISTSNVAGTANSATLDVTWHNDNEGFGPLSWPGNVVTFVDGKISRWDWAPPVYGE